MRTCADTMADPVSPVEPKVGASGPVANAPTGSPRVHFDDDGEVEDSLIVASVQCIPCISCQRPCVRSQGHDCACQHPLDGGGKHHGA